MLARMAPSLRILLNSGRRIWSPRSASNRRQSDEAVFLVFLGSSSTQALKLRLAASPSLLHLFAEEYLTTLARQVDNLNSFIGKRFPRTRSRIRIPRADD